MKTTHAKKTNARVLTLLVAVILAVTMIFPLTTGNVCAASPYLNVRVLHMQAGQTFTLKLKHAKKVRWKSSNKKVAGVSNGKVTALKAGSATITAKKGKEKLQVQGDRSKRGHQVPDHLLLRDRKHKEGGRQIAKAG